MLQLLICVDLEVATDDDYEEISIVHQTEADSTVAASHDSLNIKLDEFKVLSMVRKHVMMQTKLWMCYEGI